MFQQFFFWHLVVICSILDAQFNKKKQVNKWSDYIEMNYLNISNDQVNFSIEVLPTLFMWMQNDQSSNNICYIITMPWWVGGLSVL